MLLQKRFKMFLCRIRCQRPAGVTNSSGTMFLRIKNHKRHGLDFFIIFFAASFHRPILFLVVFFSGYRQNNRLSSPIITILNEFRVLFTVLIRYSVCTIRRYCCFAISFILPKSFSVIHRKIRVFLLVLINLSTNLLPALRRSFKTAMTRTTFSSVFFVSSMFHFPPSILKPNMPPKYETYN